MSARMNTDVKETCTPVVGMLLLLEYGNGTQPARVLAISPRGVMKIERGYRGNRSLGNSICWTPAKLRVDDQRILGELPMSDKRRRWIGFNETTATVKGGES